MNHRPLRLIVLLLLFLCNTISGTAQSISIGTYADQLYQYHLTRRGGDSGLGVINRPSWFCHTAGLDDSAVAGLVRSRLFASWSKKVFWGVLPASAEMQYISHHPVNQNDGTMLASKGLQTRVSAGVFAQAGPLALQLMPEVVLATNSKYTTTPNFGSSTVKSYNKSFLGQSAVRLNAGPAAVSLSTENLWWGPGYFYSLLMSNQAPGFLHLKFHSLKPLKTPIGSFEWMLIGGRLASDADLPFGNQHERINNRLGFIGDRYLNAYLFSYQPRFLPGLHVGLTRALQTYEDDISGQENSFLNKYIPVLFKPFQKTNVQDDDQQRIDQLASVFFKWYWKNAKAELYGELGFNDYKKNIRDFVLNVPHSAAYQIGFRKIIDLQPGKSIDAQFELTQLAQSPDQLVRDAGNWYFHSQILEGYTHQNQVMGSVFGANAQTLQISLQQGLLRTSISLQHLQREPGLNLAYWNDWTVSGYHVRPWKNFVVEGQLGIMYSSQYGWNKSANPVQLIAKTGIRYYFNEL